jgi:ELWxxDGT repeat protein
MNFKKYNYVFTFLLSILITSFGHAQISLLKDINEGYNDCTYSARSETVNGIAYFPAKNAKGGELWQTDGSINGTKMVKDIKPDAGSSNPKCLFPVGNRLYFLADDGVNGTELWRTDSIEGAVLVKDILKGSESTKFVIPFIEKETFCNIGEKIYFIVNGDGIYESDGSELGTKLIYNSVGKFQNLRKLVSYNGNLFFVAETIGTFTYTYLLKFDFTTNDIEYLTSGSKSPENLISTPWGLIYNLWNNLYLSKGDKNSGERLLMTDKTTFGGYKFTNSSYFFKGNLYFIVDTVYPYAPQLYRTNGTTEGTKLVKKIATKYYASYAYFKATEDYLYFLFNNDSNNSSFSSRELWRTDSTEAGTIKIDSFYGGAVNYLTRADEMGVFDNRLFYYAPKSDYGLLRSTNGVLGESINEDTLNSSSKFYNLVTGIMPIKYGVTFITKADDNKNIGEELWRLTKPKEKFSLKIDELNKLKCFGDKDGILKASALGGFPPYKFTWSNGTNDSTLTNLAVGNYIVTVEDFLSYKISSNFSMNQPTKISTTITATKSNVDLMQGTISLSVGGGSFPYSYKWNTPNNDSVSFVKNLNPGTYFVTITDSNGCIKIDSAVVGIISGIKDLIEKDPLLVSPNPTSNELNIHLPNDFDCNGTTVQCFNLQGKLIKTATMNCYNTEVLGSKINVSDLVSGFYLLIVKDQQKTEKAKFIKIN